MKKFLSIAIMLITLASSCNKNIEVTDVILNPETLTLTVNETATLIATVLPADATNKELIWESSDPSVVSVDNSGKITALAEETATITVTTVDGGKKASCVVTVEEEDIYPIVLPITEYKLYPLYPCFWINWVDKLSPDLFNYDGTPYIINDSEEMNNWVSCSGEGAPPEVDFSKNTLLVTIGRNCCDVPRFKDATFVKENKNNYFLELIIMNGATGSDGKWVFGFLVPKIEPNADIIVDCIYVPWE